MENVTLSKDQKLITITEDKWKEYEDNTRKALDNTITIRSSHYSYYGTGHDNYSRSEKEHKSISSVIPELQRVIKENQEILDNIRKTEKDNKEILKEVKENRELLNFAHIKFQEEKEEHSKEIQKVPKFIRKWFKINV